MNLKEIFKNWDSFASELPLGLSQQLAQQSELALWEKTGNLLLLLLRCKESSLCNKKSIEKLEAAIAQVLGCSVAITVEIIKEEK